MARRKAAREMPCGRCGAGDADRAMSSRVDDEGGLGDAQEGRAGRDSKRESTPRGAIRLEMMLRGQRGERGR
ncbi:hypothetical protein KSP39_PZI002467 [Platanthera zijinensis]|uniref:Uncharacterized protein n=1 Tax=Platanthera zijinensis TaxID=2320716 RepID=A0AAP0BZM9_9ASPA